MYRSLAVCGVFVHVAVSDIHDHRKHVVVGQVKASGALLHNAVKVIVGGYQNIIVVCEELICFPLWTIDAGYLHLVRHLGKIWSVVFDEKIAQLFGMWERMVEAEEVQKVVGNVKVM